MLNVSSVAILMAASAVVSCGPSPAPAQRSINPLIVSEEYAQKHHPTLVPKGVERAWHVEDHGDIWTVEMFKQGMMGGGIKMAIRKDDGQVIGSELTQ